MGSLHTGVKFRQDDFGNASPVGDPKVFGMGGGHQLDELGLDSLCAYEPEIGGKLLYGLLGLGFNPVSQLGGEADCAQYAQGILRKTLPWAAYTADDACP